MSGKNIIKKNFLVITPNFFPENFPINTFVDYLSINNKVTVVTSTPNYIKQSAFTSIDFSKYFKYKKSNINIIRIPTISRIYDNFFFVIFFYSSYFFTFSIFFIFYSLITKNKFDHVIIYSISPVFSTFFGKIYSTISQIKIYVWVQDIWPEAIITSLTSKFKFIEKSLKKFQDFLWGNSEIITQSIKMKSFFEKKTLIKKINIIHNPPRFVKKTFYKNIKFKKNKILTFSYFGNIGKAQDLHKILEIICNLKINFKINIYGSGTELNRIKKKYENSRIKFLLWQEENKLIKNFKSTDFFLLPLKTYKRQKYILPGKFSTYLNYAKPIIALGNTGSALQYYINRFKIGFFIDNKYSKKKNLELIQKFLNTNNNKYNLMCKNCFNCYNKFFSKESIIKQIEKTFNIS